MIANNLIDRKLADAAETNNHYRLLSCVSLDDDGASFVRFVGMILCVCVCVCVKLTVQAVVIVTKETD